MVEMQQLRKNKRISIERIYFVCQVHMSNLSIQAHSVKCAQLKQI